MIDIVISISLNYLVEEQRMLVWMKKMSHVGHVMDMCFVFVNLHFNGAFLLASWLSDFGLARDVTSDCVGRTRTLCDFWTVAV